jgi:two-component system response regulator VicR
MVSGDIEVNCREMKVYKEGEEIALSKKELQLLVYLWENAGRIVSKENILEHIWDVDGQFVDDNTVTVNISRLRSKLGTGEISNVRGLGYIWSGAVIRK